MTQTDPTPRGRNHLPTRLTAAGLIAAGALTFNACKTEAVPQQPTAKTVEASASAPDTGEKMEKMRLSGEFQKQGRDAATAVFDILDRPDSGAEADADANGGYFIDNKAAGAGADLQEGTPDDLTTAPQAMAHLDSKTGTLYLLAADSGNRTLFNGFNVIVSVGDKSLLTGFSGENGTPTVADFRNVLNDETSMVTAFQGNVGVTSDDGKKYQKSYGVMGKPNGDGIIDQLRSGQGDGLGAVDIFNGKGFDTEYDKNTANTIGDLVKATASELARS